VQIDYRLRQGSERLEVTVRLNNTAKDHWLRANFPSGIETDVSTSDTHFDVISRPIALPDSTGWVEEAFGTHPLQTFVSLDDTRDCFAVLPHGLFEYEVLEDDAHTLALTLLRACRIKLAVSEEKLTELPDTGVQCPGEQVFRYAIFAGKGDWSENTLLSQAADANNPVRAIMTSRGHGTLPLEGGLFTLDNTVLHVSAVKQAEDGAGTIVRLFNPCETAQPATLAFRRAITAASRCRMDESELHALEPAGEKLELLLEAKKIYTVRVRL
jgi:alpha-mannosidase